MLTRLHAYMLTAIALILYTALMIALIIRAMRRFYGGYSCSFGHTREYSLRRSTSMLMECWSGRWKMPVEFFGELSERGSGFLRVLSTAKLDARRRNPPSPF